MKAWLRQLRNERGLGNSVTIPLLVLILAIFSYLGLDAWGYFMTKQKLKTAVNETFEIVKAENGFDSSTRVIFNDFAQKLGFDPSAILVEGTGKTVQRGMPVHMKAQTTYEVKSLRPFGQTIIMQVTSEIDGLAQTKIR